MSKKLRFVIFALVLLVLGAGIFFFSNREENITLSISEKKWIESNKNKLLDLSVLNDVPIVNNNGLGILFDFLSDLEEDTGLEFNKLSYSDKQSSDYALKKVSDYSEKDILFYEDNYVLVSNKKDYYTNVSSLKNLTIGTLKDNLTSVSEYLTGGSNLTYKTYDNVSSMISGLSDGSINSFAISKLSYLSLLSLNSDLKIVYNITDYKDNYVLTLGDNNKLNNILKKYFTKWEKDNYEDSFNKYLSDSYFTYNKVDEKEQAKFRSKRYTYGFVLNAPYDSLNNDGVFGFNYSLINNFANMANIEIDYKRYSSYDSLNDDLSSNKVDLMFDYISSRKYNTDIHKSISVYDGNMAVISNNENLTVNSVSSLKKEKVLTIKGSKIDKYLNSYGFKTKTYNTSRELINHLNSDSVAVLDEVIYDYYVRSDLSSFRNVQTLPLNDNLGFISLDNSSNKTFNEFFDFYLSFVNTDYKIQESYKDLLIYNNSNKSLKLILSSIFLFLVLIILFITYKVFKRKKSYNGKLSKTDKLRYVDTLTSLKNRNYLNDNMAKWDSSDVYPQAIVIIDLNNVAYINDNFGHVEGDKVITEAAGILINNQLSNSEIIRTNGNEFLVFLAKHDEKDVVTYIRKLNREFKNLSHGFGAALGYSMITDEIKTIDDAVNEATMDMKKNKEGLS